MRFLCDAGADEGKAGVAVVRARAHEKLYVYARALWHFSPRGLGEKQVEEGRAKEEGGGRRRKGEGVGRRREEAGGGRRKEETGRGRKGEGAR